MVKKGAIPNAWDDDDWETQADKAEAIPSPPPTEPTKISKAERLAKHADENKKLWDSAETPSPIHYLTSQSTIPLKTEFKPALKVLRRKPAPKTITKQDPITGLQQMTIEDEDDDEEEDDARNKLSPEEARAKAQREREEKQRKYDEVRAKIFGTDTSSSAGGVVTGGGVGAGSSISGSSTPGNVTPPTSESNRGGGGRISRNRGGFNSTSTREKSAQGLRIESRRPCSSSSAQRELFDPNYSPKPGSSSGTGVGAIGVGVGAGGINHHQRGNSSSGRSTPREKEESQILRQPKAPDSSGRVGFGVGSGGRGNRGA